jgi:hypothetical protein
MIGIIDHIGRLRYALFMQVSNQVIGRVVRECSNDAVAQWTITKDQDSLSTHAGVPINRGNGLVIRRQ